MKKLLMFTSLIAAAAIVSGLGGCTTATTANNAAISASQKQMMLTQSGFVSKTVTTTKQKSQVDKLPVEVVSAVKYKGNLYYVYPTAKKDQILIGKQKHYDAYKKMLVAQASKASTAPVAEGPSQSSTGGVYLTGETAGPNHIMVQELDGFGPIQDQPEWR